uniref:Uncharacterized protein n=1 Tax=Ditylenchus dipsaci TaxID=166011 RepID=A0A915CMZ1_9BILA
MNNSLLKFIITSGQSVNLMGDQGFIEFLDSYRLVSLLFISQKKIRVVVFRVEAEKTGSKKTAKICYLQENTMSKRIDAKLEGVKVDVLTKLEQLKSIGRGLTQDFAKKNVDYLAVTAHIVDNNWSVNIEFVTTIEE